jgi:hypothetical protein
LAGIAEQQGRQDRGHPGARDRPAAEVAHVGIQCFGTGDGEHDGTQRQEGA